MAVNGKTPTVLQMQILDLWAQGISRQEIAKQLGCSIETVDYAKQQPELKQQFYQRQMAQIEELVPLAISRLKQLLADDKQQGAVHIGAVREVLDRAHLKELMDAPQGKLEIVISYE